MGCLKNTELSTKANADKITLISRSQGKKGGTKSPVLVLGAKKKRFNVTNYITGYAVLTDCGEDITFSFSKRTLNSISIVDNENIYESFKGLHPYTCVLINDYQDDTREFILSKVSDPINLNEKNTLSLLSYALEETFVDNNISTDSRKFIIFKNNDVERLKEMLESAKDSLSINYKDIDVIMDLVLD